jgi:hypothetical protein
VIDQTWKPKHTEAFQAYLTICQGAFLVPTRARHEKFHQKLPIMPRWLCLELAGKTSWSIVFWIKEWGSI